MKKIFNYMLAFAATATLATACSKDEPAGNDAPGTFEPGQAAYLNVQLRSTDDLTRAGEGTDVTEKPTDGYEDGTGNESSINSAYFYFFDANQVYVGQSNIWNGSTAGEKPNIELKGNSVVVLDNLKGNTYPSYMVTILNGTPYTNADLAGKTLTDFSKDLTNWGTDAANGFVMATTSYYSSESLADANHQNFATINGNSVPTYYATKLTANNFAQSKDAALAESVPAVVYVERLAARVKLTTPNNLDVFPVDVTVMGGVNDNPSLENTGSNTAGTKLQVKVLGWYLNAQQEKTHLLKQFGDWTSAASLTEVNSWAWNVPVFHRSFWGQANNYGSLTENNLKYYAWNNTEVKNVGQVAYCNENMTSKANLVVTGATQPNHRLLTSVIVKAEVQYADGKAVDLVEHNGAYFEKSRFIQMILDIAKGKNQLNLYTRAETGKDEHNQPIYTYYQVNAGFFTLDGDNSHVYVKKDKTFPAADQLWTKQANGEYDQVGIDALVAALDANLKAINASDNTTAFTGGAMYYQIPIEHLNTPVRNADKVVTAFYEGSYGVVRNHAYTVNINQVKRLGNGVFNPDTEVIKPPFTPKEDPNWFLGATINVLSWKVVTSNVDL